MILTAIKGRPFIEEFTFKNEKGQSIVVPAGDYVLTLERGDSVKETQTLKRERERILWIMTADETKALKYKTMYFTLSFKGTELARGVLRVQ